MWIPIDVTTWQGPRRTHDVHSQTLAAIGEGGRSVVDMLWLFLAAHTYFAARYMTGYTWWQDVLTVVVVWVVHTYASLHYRYSKAIGGMAILALSAVLSIITWWQITQVHPNALSNLGSWVIGMVAVPATLIAFYSPIEWVVVLMAPQVLTLAAAALDSERGLSGASGGFFVTCAPLFCWGLAAMIRFSHGLAMKSNALTAEQATSALSEVAANRVGEQVFTHAREVVYPWLASVSSQGDVVGASNDARKSARSLAIEVRDELYLSGLLDDSLRLRIRHIRDQHVEVIFLPPDGDMQAPAPVLRVLDRLFDIQHPFERIMVSLPTAELPTASVTVVPGMSDGSWRVISSSLHPNASRLEQDEFGDTLHLCPTKVTSSEVTR